MSGNRGFTVVIPARFGSRRLPGKPLADIAGRPMIQHVYERSVASDASRVIIATDDERIYKAAEGFGAEVCMTLAGHPTGTDRLQEVAQTVGLDDNDIVVNVQGDEPLIPPSVINQVAGNLMAAPEAGAATLCDPIHSVDQAFDPNVVKVVADARGYALYFSRAAIPWERESFAEEPRKLSQVQGGYRHVGIYAYRVELLNRFVQWGVCPLEQVEALEQLRLMWNGYRIHVAEALETPPHGVDTEQDLQAVRQLLEAQQLEAAGSGEKAL